MTPERLATLCGLLPEWEFRDIGVNSPDSYCVGPADSQGLRQEGRIDGALADHLLMEALRAVRKRGFIVSMESELDSAGNPEDAVTLWTRSHNSPQFQATSDNPLHALLDAVRKAGL